MNKQKLNQILKFVFSSFIWLGVAIFLLDIITKWCAQNLIIEGQPVVLIPGFFKLALSHNEGAAWSLGDSGSVGMRILWISVSVILSAALIFYYVKQYKKMTTWYRVALMLMISGAVGNMIDRMFYWDAIVGFNGVIDWISFTFGTYNFPSFNIADSSLVVGVIIILVLIIIELIQDSIKKGKEGGYKLPPKEYEKQQELKKQQEQQKALDESKKENNEEVHN